MRKKLSGVYKIQSAIKPERCYIGSSFDIKHRWQGHLTDLNRNVHSNSKLQRHFNKYGQQDLIFTVILCCEENELITNEQFFIDAYNPYFNICKIAYSKLGVTGQVAWNKGIKNCFSEEVIKKMSESRKGNNYSYGRILSDETKKKISDGNRGKIVTDKMKENMSISHKGLKRTEEQKKRCSEAQRKRAPLMSIAMMGENNPFYGKKHTEETKNKISEKAKGKYIGENNPFYGKKHTPETRLKMQMARKLRISKPHSEETKQKMRHPHKQYIKKVI